MFEYGVILNGSQTLSRTNGRAIIFEYGVILDYNEFLYKIIRTSAFRRGSYYSFVAQGLRVCSNFGGRGKQPFPTDFRWFLYL